jgi:choline dehydrogenase
VRTNWLTLVNHQVIGINWASGGTKKTATGVRFKQADNTGQTYTVNARKEVILAAGAIMTPALLQLSGVGDPAVLNPLGIQTVINLPTVGKNLQERTMTSHGARGNGFDVGGRGPSNVIAFANINEVYGSGAQDAINDINANYATWAKQQASRGASAAALTTIFGIQKDLIVNKKGRSSSPRPHISQKRLPSSRSSYCRVLLQHGPPRYNRCRRLATPSL